MKRTSLHFTSLMIALLLVSTSTAQAFPFHFLNVLGHSPERLIEEGQYDAAINKTLNKLRGKKRKKTKHVVALEEAFRRANSLDMAAINRLKLEARPENWDDIFDIAKRIEYRQNRVAPLLPLVDRNGFQAAFVFVKTDVILQDAREKAAAYVYAQASQLMYEARRGDKKAAKDAYYRLEGINEYYANYRDKAALQREALALGTVHVLYRVRNNAPVLLPANFERELLRMSVGELDSKWKRFYTRRPTNVGLDYEVVMNLRNIEVSPSRVTEREFQEVKEITDGFEYVYDKRGNMKLDSLGNAIKVPRKVQVSAWVLESFQNKAAYVSGRLEYYDSRTGELVSTKPMLAEAVFEHHAATFRGDRRALSPNSCRIIDNAPLPFPSDAALLLDAADQLRPLIRRHIRNAAI